MVEPVSRVQSYNSSGVKVGGTKSGLSGEEKPFSMDQQIAEEAAREEGVYYERSKNEAPKKEVKPESKKESEEIFEKPGAEAPLGAIDTGNLVKGINKFLKDLWQKALKIFENIWESKPINESGGSNEKQASDEDILKSQDDIIQDSHLEESLNYQKSQYPGAETEQGEASGVKGAASGQTVDEAYADVEGTAQDDFDRNIAMMEHIKPYEDKAIKDALLSGDDERFERIITRGGERHAAISSTLLTQYNARGQIIQIDPSDENLILRGTTKTNRS